MPNSQIFLKGRKIKRLINRICLFFRVIVGATRSNHAHWASGGRGGKGWLASIPFTETGALWAVTDSYGQMAAQVGVMDWYHDDDTGETVDEWVQTHVEDVGLDVFMATKEWRDQGASPGIVQFNPHKWSQNGYFLCFLSKGKVLPLPWLWGTVIPHPDTLKEERKEVEAENNRLHANAAEELRLFRAGLIEPRRSGRSSRANVKL